MKAKNIIVLTILFLAINIVVFTVTQVNTNDRINIALKKDMETLKTHFDILNISQQNIAYAISQSILRNTNLVEYLSVHISEYWDTLAGHTGTEKLYEKIKELILNMDKGFI